MEAKTFIITYIFASQLWGSHKLREEGPQENSWEWSTFS